MLHNDFRYGWFGKTKNGMVVVFSLNKYFKSKQCPGNHLAVSASLAFLVSMCESHSQNTLSTDINDYINDIGGSYFINARKKNNNNHWIISWSVIILSTKCLWAPQTDRRQHNIGNVVALPLLILSNEKFEGLSVTNVVTLFV